MGQEPVWRAGKKLEAAAEYWLSGGQQKKSREKLEEDARVLGVILVGGPEGKEEEDVFKVWPENWDSLVWWNRVATQWRVGMAGPVGGDYGSWFELFRLYGVENQRELFEDLQLMEGVVLSKLAEGQG
jgi:hypothetical protein